MQCIKIMAREGKKTQYAYIFNTSGAIYSKTNELDANKSIVALNHATFVSPQ